MIDTIHIRYQTSKLNGIIEELHNYEQKNYFKDSNGVNININKIDNNFYWIKLNLNLNKYKYGNNIARIRFNEIREVICEISERYNFAYDEAYISRIDIGATILVNEEPIKYISLIDSYPRFRERVEIGIKEIETLEFRSNNKKIVIYNKSKEVTKKFKKSLEMPIAISSILPNINLIRYELVLKNALDKQLKLGHPMTCIDLLNRIVYKGLVDLWYNTFHKLRINKTETYEAKNWKETLMLLGMEYVGSKLSKAIVVDYSKTHNWNKTTFENNLNSYYNLIYNKKKNNSNKYYLELSEKIKIEKKYYL